MDQVSRLIKLLCGKISIPVGVLSLATVFGHNKHMAQPPSVYNGESYILSIPVELLSRIFVCCDNFRQVIALASVCKHTYKTWNANSMAVIWGVGNSQIRSFDDALMAVSIFLDFLSMFS